jgi:Xaa-Pro aminopeptidase
MTERTTFLANRLEKLREKMLDRGCDGILLFVVEGLGWQNCYYFSGFRGSSAALLITEGEKLLVTDGRYRLQASEQSDFEIVIQGRTPLLDVIKELLEKKGLKRVGIDGERLPVSVFRKITGPSSIEDVSGLLSLIRRTKDACEREDIIRAARISCSALQKVAAQVKDPVAEKDISAALEYFIKMAGADGGWQDHDFIVASGWRSALPHGRAGERKIHPGEWATIDYGARFSGYVCDVTRNLFYGEIPEEWKKRHEILLEAQSIAAGKVSPGVPAADVDAAARRVIEEAGYGDYFIHGLGHGIGLDLHESPRLSPRSGDILQEGDVITIEPGIYIDGEGGMRIEDDYMVTSKGVECLTGMIPKTLSAGR